MSRPCVTIIMPVYNAGETLARSLQSVLNQTYTELEIITMDDGSKDNSLAILHTFAKRDARIRVITQANTGVSEARNRAILQATGEYVQFVDSDDVVPPDATERMVNAITAANAQLAIAPYTEVVGTLRTVRGFLREETVYTQAKFLDKFSLRPNSFFYSVMWNKLYRRDTMVDNDVRCDNRLPWGEDFAFNASYLRFVTRVAGLSEPVYDYIRNVNGLALTTGVRCVLHPLHNCMCKWHMYEHYVALFKHAGLYEQYKRVLPRYLFRFTINN